MRLVITGGGTGGHVFPALEVARAALAEGADVKYLGSLRGQERSACQKAGIPFAGFPSEPIYKIKSLSGLRALVRLAKSTLMARSYLKRDRPTVVFSTGGYASAPVVRAALMLHIPYVLHEQNSVPGRSNLLAAKRAASVATTFAAAGAHFEGIPHERTGLPIRKELRDAAMEPRLMEAEPFSILAVGGSQGAASLNEAVLATAARMSANLHWTHATGKRHFEKLFPTYEKLGIGSIYKMKSFLEGREMAEAYAGASMVIGRSGAGTLAELAAFGLPSILIPYSFAHANHQYYNAKEFESMGAATVIEQSDLHPARLEEALNGWIGATSAFESARSALAAWDCPDAAQRILAMIRVHSSS